VSAIEVAPREAPVASFEPWVARLTPRDPSALAIVGPPGPAMSARSGPRTAVFDGVLYNAAELARTLALRPDANDATIVLQAYERWGLEVLQKIKGIFALALWNADDRSGLIARDPLGNYPLFYAEVGDELLISTSIDALLSCDGVSKSLDRAALADHLCHRWPDRDGTYFDAVKRVRTCHALVIEGGTRRLDRYWDPAPPGEPMNWIGEDELDRFGDLFDQAVNRCLGFGPTGIFLSGGFDSVSVAAVATENCRMRGLPAPLALSVAFPHPDCNEEAVQTGVANELGLEQIMLPLEDAVRPNGLMQAACALQAGRSAPMLTYYAPPYFQLAEAARARGYNAVLTGGGGDEWLCVTPLLAADLITKGDVRGLIRHTKSMQRSFNLPARTVWRNSLWVYGLRQLLGSAAGFTLRRVAPGRLQSYRRRKVASVPPEWLAPDATLRDELEHRNLEAWPERPTDGWYRHDLRNGLDHAVTAMEMEEFFENARITGVRTLCPYMDADLVDFLYRVPPELLDRGGRSKGLVRHEVARRFPELGFERHKKVSAISYSRSVVLEEGERAWRASGGTPALEELDVIDEQAFERELRTILADRHEDSYRLWDVLNLEAWTRTRI
jgi:asparagine synthase (glutamine-hydrolysing)